MASIEVLMTLFNLRNRLEHVDAAFHAEGPDRLHHRKAFNYAHTTDHRRTEADCSVCIDSSRPAPNVVFNY